MGKILSGPVQNVMIFSSVGMTRGQRIRVVVVVLLLLLLLQHLSDILTFWKIFKSKYGSNIVFLGKYLKPMVEAE